MAHKILITGAGGLIGQRLTALLLKNGHAVSHLGRSLGKSNVPSFTWNLASRTIDARCLDGVDTIFHLAGANVAERRWTASRKKEILSSRVDSTQLLAEALKKNTNSVRTFISASAIGYYGFNDPEKIFTEDDPSANDFLAQVTSQWEQAADEIEKLTIRTAIIRIGIVLSSKGGALSAMTMPIRNGIGAVLGSGKQMLSWIHIDDVCRMFVLAVESQNINGAYNAATNWCSNEEITHSIGAVLQKKIWLPAVPPFVLKLMLGEMADIVLNGSKVSSEKIVRAGFKFEFTDLQVTLRNLLVK
jgi:uncharacterized protein (TIGR01777 family)